MENQDKRTRHLFDEGVDPGPGTGETSLRSIMIEDLERIYNCESLFDLIDLKVNLKYISIFLVACCTIPHFLGLLVRWSRLSQFLASKCPCPSARDFVSHVSGLVC